MNTQNHTSTKELIEKSNRLASLSIKMTIFFGILLILSIFIMVTYEFGSNGYQIGTRIFFISLFSFAVGFALLVYCGLLFEELQVKNRNETLSIILTKYHQSLSIGDRKSALQYGRMCGFSEHKITNDLLCLLNNK